MNNENNELGLFEIAFNGTERGIEVKQYNKKDEVSVDTSLEAENALEMNVETADGTMDVPALTIDLLNKIRANESVRMTESTIARRKAMEAYNRQREDMQSEDR